MKKEKKTSKTKKVLKFLLGIGATGLALYTADKYIPGFNEKVTKPVKGLADTVANDIKEYLLKDDKPVQQVSEERRPQRHEHPRRDMRENNVNVEENNNRKHHSHHHNNRQQKNF
jgi:hypothetical protein